jgi:hypothetical protein
MERAEMQRVYRLLKEAHEQGLVPWHWVVDETRELEKVSTPSLVVKLLDRDHAHTLVMAELPHISLVQAATNADLDRALRIDEPLFDRPAKRRAVMEARSEIVIARVAMGIDMHQAERSIPDNCPQNQKRDRMVAADRQRRHASFMDGGEEGIDFHVSPFQFEGPFEPNVAQDQSNKVLTST